MKYLYRMEIQQPVALLDVGGGQIAMLARALRGDTTSVLDISDQYQEYLTRFGIELITCDLVHDDAPDVRAFDVIVFSEVLEHLPIPPYLVLEKLKSLLKPGGYLLLTTPNLHRLRNLARMVTATDFVTFFRYAAPGVGLGHIMEYSCDHLRWQVERAGLAVEWVEYRHFLHNPYRLTERLVYWIGCPLALRPRWRDNLVALARRHA